MCRARVASILLSSKTDLVALFVLIALPACHTGRPGGFPERPPVVSVNTANATQLQRDIDSILAAPSLARSTWGIQVRSASNDDRLYSLNAGKLLMPGSTMKIVTLAAAAERLHWDYVFETRLLAAGRFDSATGTLDGDLLVAGSGDPTIVDSDGTATRLFAEWAQTLKARGVRTIAGRVIGDDNVFDDDTLGPGWAWDDLPGRDATAVSGLQFNENVVLATIKPGPAIGSAAVITLAPDGSSLVLDDRLITSPAETEPSIRARRSGSSNRLELQGSIPIGSGPFVRAVSVDNPTLFFAAALRNALIASGIDVRGPAADLDDVDLAPAGIPEVLSIHHSPPLSAISMRLMKDSQNLYAETLLKTLGGTSGVPGFENGRLTAAAILAPWGVDRDGIVQVDGSGLSRYNYVTAESLASILLHIDRDDVLRSPFEASLPIAGVDGTLAVRMKGTSAEGNARAKSGTLANARSLAGYVTAADGEPLVFAIIANNFGRNPEAAIAAIDAIVVKLAQFRR